MVNGSSQLEAWAHSPQNNVLYLVTLENLNFILPFGNLLLACDFTPTDTAQGDVTTLLEPQPRFI